MRVKLTDRFCATAKANERVEYFDAATKGLALRVSPTAKTWCFHYTRSGQRARLTIGTYPATSLAAARTSVIEARAALEAGQAPKAIKPTTFQAIAEEYLARTDMRSKGARASALARLVYPAIGSMPIGEVRRSDIVRMLDGIADDAGPVAADRALGHVRKIMNWHATRSDDFRSPIVAGMSRNAAKDRDRILTDAELRALWSATDSAAPFARFIRFLLLTATRRNEAAFATWAEFNGSLWTIPPERYKTGVEHTVPLSAAAITSMGEGVLGSLSGRLFEFGSPARRKAELDEASGTSGWTLHDLRRTARSLMSRAGVSADIAERCLGHVLPGIRATYDRHLYMEEKRAAFAALAGLVERIVGAKA
jgi:integrase